MEEQCHRLLKHIISFLEVLALIVWKIDGGLSVVGEIFAVRQWKGDKVKERDQIGRDFGEAMDVARGAECWMKTKN